MLLRRSRSSLDRPKRQARRWPVPVLSLSAWSEALRRLPRASLALGAWLAVCAPARRGYALPPNGTLEDVTSLDYAGACVTEAELLRELSRWVKRRGTLPADLSVRVTGQDAPTFHARFEIARAGSVVASREFSGDRVQCQQRVAVLASALGLSLENYLETAAPLEREVAPKPLKPVQRAAGTSWLGTSYVGAWAGVGLLPEPTWAATIAAGLSRNSWGIRAAVLLTPFQGLPLGDGSAKVQLLGGGLSGCRLGRLVMLPAEVCLETQAGMLRISGSGYAVSLQSQDWFLDGAARLQLEVPLVRRVAIYAGARVGMTVHATELTVREAEGRALLVSRAWPAFSYGLVAGMRFDLASRGTEEFVRSGH